MISKKSEIKGERGYQSNEIRLIGNYQSLPGTNHRLLICDWRKVNSDCNEFE